MSQPLCRGHQELTKLSSSANYYQTCTTNLQVLRLKLSLTAEPAHVQKMLVQMLPLAATVSPFRRKNLKYLSRWWLGNRQYSADANDIYNSELE